MTERAAVVTDPGKALTGRVALVTGASRGIGRAIAIRLAADGADVVVHYRQANAGVELIDTPFVDYVEAQYDQVFDTNTKGVFFTMQEAARSVGGGGRIIVVSSNTTRLALPGFAAYGASKLAALYFVEVLAKELGPRGITVNSVVPGATLAAGVFADSADGDLGVRPLVERTPLGRLATPGDVAGVVRFLVGKDATFITGQHLAVDGGASI